MRDVLTGRNGVIFFGGQALSLFGDSSMWMAAGIWVKDMTGSSAAAGMIFFAFAAPLLLAPVAGLLADRFRRRPLLVCTNLVVGAAVLLLLTVDGPADVWLVYVVMFVNGAGFTILGAAQSALLTGLFEPALLPNANSVLQTLREGLKLVAPLAGAAIYAWHGPAVVIALDAVTFAAGAASVSLLRVREERPAPLGQPLTALAAGWRHIAGVPRLRTIIAATASVLIVVGFSETLIYAINDEALHRPATFVAALLCAQGVGAVAAGLTAPLAVRRFGETTTAGVGVAVFGCGAALLTVPLLGVVVAALALFGAGLAWLLVSGHTLLQRLSPPALQGRVFATAELLTSGPQTLSIALGAALVSLLHYRIPLIIMAATAAAVAAFLIVSRTVELGGKKETAVPSADTAR
ncbi:MFS transporter [Dactylosporangium sp. NPDC005555]|uniref:MFS transporter n=1 Tax=Dactylosporangium sp. NPDC005555 TaxID=3154889 RepID=UPI0033BDA2A4